MFCGKCGAEIADGLEVCPKCGKSLKAAEAVAAGNQAGQGGGFPLTNLTAKLFGVFFEITLWGLLMGGLVLGGVLGYAFFSEFNLAMVFLGGLLAFFIIISTGGLVSLILKIVSNTEEIKRKLK